MSNFVKLRHNMLEKHTAARGVCSELVLKVMRIVPREAFASKERQELTHEDATLPLRVHYVRKVEEINSFLKFIIASIIS